MWAQQTQDTLFSCGHSCLHEVLIGLGRLILSGSVDL